jgi:integrase
VLNNYRSTGKSLGEVRKVLDAFSVVRTPETTSLDPHPISRANWDTLYKSQAEQPEGKAMLLVALNLCMYPIDLARLQWSELDLDRGTYSANRGKTRVAKVACLWPEATKALQALARSAEDNHVFHKANGQPHTDTTIRKWFYDLRDDLKLDKAVQLADLRDGAFTEAVQGQGVQFNHAQILAGHRSGMADHYVRRNPKMVAEACEAVRKAYLA